MSLGVPIGRVAVRELVTGIVTGVLVAVSFFVLTLALWDLPVTIGNVIGGALLVGAVYWFVYRRADTTPGVTAPGNGATPPST